MADRLRRVTIHDRRGARGLHLAIGPLPCRSVSDEDLLRVRRGVTSRCGVTLED